MDNNNLLILIAMSLIAMCSAKISFESRLRNCGTTNEELNVCLKGLMEDIKPLLSVGIPELNVPILEPISLQNLSFAQRDGPVNLRAQFKDVLVTGFSNFTLEDIQTNLENLLLTVRVFIPILRVSGRYTLDGNLLLLPITGDGPFRATLLDINAGMKSKIVLKNEGGKERIGVTDTKINFNLRSTRARLNNLFNGDPILGETVNHFINTNDQMILREVKPAISKDISLLIESVMDNALSTLPVDLIKPLVK